MKYIIIGLGNYGRVLAEELSALGHEIIGVDQNEHRVNVLKETIAISYILDVEEEAALSVLPLNNVDAVMVCIGENFGASIRVVAMLKKLEVKHIFARAIDATHKAILEAFSIEKILAPEEEAARIFVQRLDFGHTIDSMQIDSESYVIKFTIPDSFSGLKVKDLNLQNEFNIEIIAVQHVVEDKNILGIKSSQYKTITSDSLKVESLVKGDKLVCIGKYKDFQVLWNSL
ncbi:MAG: TrkA family potassium uptake protein [Bacteroidales bacterium]